MTISFAQDTGITEKRRALRAGLGVDAALRERGRTALPVKVSTFSAYGCQVDGYVPTSADGQAWLKLPGLESQLVTVVWSCGGSLGLSFDRPLHPSVAARYLPAAGSHAADYAARHPAANDSLLSRREQILTGIAGSDLSPLQRRKKPSGLGLSGKISRTYQRQANHRFETRHGENLHQGPREVLVDGNGGAVRNVSASGLRVALPSLAQLEIGGAVTVEFTGFEPLAGRVVWLNNGEAGISLPPQAIELFDSAE